MASMSSITMQSLGKIVLRAPAVGAKICCLIFLSRYTVFFQSLLLLVHPHSATIQVDICDYLYEQQTYRPI